MSQENSLNLPPITLHDEPEKVPGVPGAAAPSTSPLISDQEVIDRLIAIVRAEHEHIGKGLVLMWGHPECQQYLHNLIDGSDSAGRRPEKNRVGFKPAVFTALMELSERHKVTKP